MDEVQCKKCGLLAVSDQQTGALVEVHRNQREGWQFPPELQIFAGPNTLLDRCPQCSAMVGDFHHDIELGLHARMIGVANTTLAEAAIRGVLAKTRQCDKFIQWDPGFSPKEHKEMQLGRGAHHLPEAPDAGTIISHGMKLYSIGNTDRRLLTAREDAVLQSFLVSPALSHERLLGRSRCDDAPRVLRQLKSKYDGLFSPAITLPGKKSAGGYRVRIRSALLQQTP